MKKLVEKAERKRKRKLRIRKTVVGSAQKPRISVYKSNKHLYAQVIDDHAGYTLASVANVGELATLKVTVADAAKLGQELGKKLKGLKIETAVFDRNGNLYHGVIKAFADGAREAGIKF